MTEEQAIERIAQALANDRNGTEGLIPDHRNAYTAGQFRCEAQVAWLEMKAIAHEDAMLREKLGMQNARPVAKPYDAYEQGARERNQLTA